MRQHRKRVLPLITIRVHAETRGVFADRYCQDMMPGGIFLRSPHFPELPLGTAIRFRFELRGGEIAFHGTAQIAWIEEGGAGLWFTELDRHNTAFCCSMIERRQDSAAPRPLPTSCLRRPRERVDSRVSEFFDAPTKRKVATVVGKRSRRLPPPLPRRRPI